MIYITGSCLPACILLSLLLLAGWLQPYHVTATTPDGDTFTVRFIDGTAAMTPDDSMQFYTFINNYGSDTTMELLLFQNMKLSCWGKPEAPYLTKRNAFVFQAVLNRSRWNLISATMPTGESKLVWIRQEDENF